MRKHLLPIVLVLGSGCSAISPTAGPPTIVADFRVREFTSDPGADTHGALSEISIGIPIQQAVKTMLAHGFEVSNRIDDEGQAFLDCRKDLVKGFGCTIWTDAYILYESGKVTDVKARQRDRCL